MGAARWGQGEAKEGRLGWGCCGRERAREREEGGMELGLEGWGGSVRVFA